MKRKLFFAISLVALTAMGLSAEEPVIYGSSAQQAPVEASVVYENPAPEEPVVYRNPAPQGKFPVFAYHSIKGDMVSHERFLEIAQSGINISFMGYDDRTMAKALDAARGTGVKLMVSCPGLRENPEETVKKFNDHPSVAGYFLKDEPSCEEYADLAERARVINKASGGKHPVYINLFPIFAKDKQFGCAGYQEYIDRYMDELAPVVGYISYDNYPVTESGLREGFYNNLEIVSEAAKANGIPFWAFALSVKHQVSVHLAPYARPDRASLRLQIFSDLAYGAQGIQYFTYLQPGPGGPEDFMHYADAPLMYEGKRTDIFDLIAELNQEVQNLSWVFLGAEKQKVIHIGKYLPRPYQRDDEFPDMIPSVVSGNNGEDLFLVSHLVNGDKHFVMIVNKDLYEPRTVTVKRMPGVKRVMPDGTLRDAALYADELQVEPGDMLLFEWE